MLLPPDADLCRRDPGLPGLPLLLDPGALLDVLRAALPEATLAALRPTYLRYKPGLSCLAAFAVDVGGGREHLIHAQTYRSDALEKYSKLTGPDPVCGPLGFGHALLPDHGLVVSAFPNDRKLKALRRLAQPKDFAPLVAKLDPAADAAATSLEVLSYKPERRLVARVSTAGRPWAVLRVYAEEAYWAALANARAFDGTPNLRVARLLGKSNWQQVLGLEYLAGQPLDERLRATGDAGAIVSSIARALADLHDQSGCGLRETASVATGERIRELARWVGFVCPELAEAAARLAERLCAGLAVSAPDADFGAIHGDFYASQILLAGEDGAGLVGLLDLDEAVRGERVADVANFIAHLEADAIRGHVMSDCVAPYAGGLTEAYREAAGRVPEDRLKLHHAAGLFRLLPHPFRRREPAWPESTRRILRRAEEVLESM